MKDTQPKRNVVNIEGLVHGSHTLAASYTNRAPSGFQASLYGFMVTRLDFWSYMAKRGLGEIKDDAHVSELKGSTGSYTFNGSGIEIYTTKDAESRTAHYTLDGGGSSLWVGLNHYSPVTLTGIEPMIFISEAAKCSVGSIISGADGMTKAGAGTLLLTSLNKYSGETKVLAGTLVVGASGTLGAGDLTVADRAVCNLENSSGTLLDFARVFLGGKCKLGIAAGVTERVAALTINGAAQPAGQYSTATHPAIISGAGVLFVVGQ